MKAARSEKQSRLSRRVAFFFYRKDLRAGGHVEQRQQRRAQAIGLVAEARSATDVGEAVHLRCTGALQLNARV